MGYATAGNPEEGVPFLFRATPKPRTGGRANRSKANRERWQGIRETTHQNPEPYEHPPVLASQSHSGHSVRRRIDGMRRREATYRGFT